MTDLLWVGKRTSLGAVIFVTDQSIPANRRFGKRFMIVSVALIALAIILNIAGDSTLMAAVPGKDKVIVKWALFAAWSVTGVVLIRHSQNVLFGMLAKNKKSDVRVPSVIVRAFSAVGYGFVAVESLHLLHIKVTSILVGGALTGVIIGIGAQSTLSNLFAGILLFTLRPFRMGQTVIIRSSSFGGVEYTGTVIDNNWFHTKIVNSEGQVITIPNSSVVIAVVTILANERVQTYTVPMPYSISLADIKEAVQTEIGDNVTVTIAIKDFAENSYTVQIGLPAHADRDALRTIIARFKAQ